MRIFLCCLIKYFEEDHSVFQALFNSRFKEELEKCGFTEGKTARWPRLEARWVSMRKDGDPSWGDVHLSGFDPEPWLPYIAMIEETAASINMPIVRKSRDSIDSSYFTYRSPPPQLQRELPIPIYDAPGLPDSPGELSLCTAGGKVCFWCHLECLDPETSGSFARAHTPRLLYRWWNVDSQGVNSKGMFVAGLFSDTSGDYFCPDDIAEDEFCHLFENHIRIKQTPSPFISTFKSLLAPIHRGLRNKEGASVSLIDAQKLNSNVYSAYDFVRKHKVKIGRTYNGAGEYLVWGTINSDAIICTFKITTLLRIAAENSDMNRLLQLDRISASQKNRKRLHQAMSKDAVYLDKQAGATVGRLLSFLEVPQEYCEIVSEGLAHSWRIKTRYNPWRDFFEGVELELSPVPDVNANDYNASESELYSLSEISTDDADDDLDFVEDANVFPTPCPSETQNAKRRFYDYF
ncbi:hypothetical protein BDW62DRAFT_210144 [Aspergillus aurantiobrunneus]